MKMKEILQRKRTMLEVFKEELSDPSIMIDKRMQEIFKEMKTSGKEVSNLDDLNYLANGLGVDRLYLMGFEVDKKGNSLIDEEEKISSSNDQSIRKLITYIRGYRGIRPKYLNYEIDKITGEKRPTRYFSPNENYNKLSKNLFLTTVGQTSNFDDDSFDESLFDESSLRISFKELYDYSKKRKYIKSDFSRLLRMYLLLFNVEDEQEFARDIFNIGPTRMSHIKNGKIKASASEMKALSNFLKLGLGRLTNDSTYSFEELYNFLESISDGEESKESGEIVLTFSSKHEKNYELEGKLNSIKEYIEEMEDNTKVINKLVNDLIESLELQKEESR